jgi:hypothetical protein
MMHALPVSHGVELLSGGVDYLLARPEDTTDEIGSVGFCMGGGFVLYQAAKDPRVTAVVTFYGVIRGELPDFSGLRAQILGHRGEPDVTVPRDSLTPSWEAPSRALSGGRISAGFPSGIRVRPGKRAENGHAQRARGQPARRPGVHPSRLLGSPHSGKRA